MRCTVTPDGDRHERNPADLRAACRVRELPDVLGERSLGPPDTWICSAGPTVSRPVAKATSWLGRGQAVPGIQALAGCADEDVPLAAVCTGTVQVGHFGGTDGGACSEPSCHDDGGIGVRGARFAAYFDGLA